MSFDFGGVVGLLSLVVQQRHFVDLLYMTFGLSNVSHAFATDYVLFRIYSYLYIFIYII